MQITVRMGQLPPYPSSNSGYLPAEKGKLPLLILHVNKVSSRGSEEFHYELLLICLSDYEEIIDLRYRALDEKLAVKPVDKAKVALNRQPY